MTSHHNIPYYIILHHNILYHILYYTAFYYTIINQIILYYTPKTAEKSHFHFIKGQEQDQEY